MAFESARSEGNIDLILPALLKSELLVMGLRLSPSELTFLVSQSPDSDRLCVTVTENEDLFKDMEGVEVMKMNGGELLRKIGAQYEIVITYPDGSDYLTKEHILWYFQSLASLK